MVNQSIKVKKVKRGKIIIYGRVNDKMGRDEQLGYIKALTDMGDFEVAGVFLEKSISLKYPAFNKMMDKIKEGGVSSVVVSSLERLPWRAALMVKFYHTLKTNRVKLVSVREGNCIGELQMWLDMELAKFERSKRSQAIKRGIKAKKTNE